VVFYYQKNSSHLTTLSVYLNEGNKAAWGDESCSKFDADHESGLRFYLTIKLRILAFFI
jgi:hypothetical protein